MNKTIVISLDLAGRLIESLENVGFVGMPNELSALLAAPVVERKPVAWLYSVLDKDHDEKYRLQVRLQPWDLISGDPRYSEEPLYTSPVAVILPESMEEQYCGNDEDKAFAQGWNACADKVRELNQ